MSCSVNASRRSESQFTTPMTVPMSSIGTASSERMPWRIST